MAKNIVIIILSVLFVIVAVWLEARLNAVSAERDILEKSVSIYEEQLNLERKKADEEIRVFSERERDNAENKAAVKEVESNNPDWSNACVPADVAVLCNDLCSDRHSAD